MTSTKAPSPIMDLIGAQVWATLKKTATTRGGEWSGPCPFCGGKDRFHVQPYWKDGEWMCRQCANDDGHWNSRYDYMMQRDGIDFHEAKRRLDGLPVGPAPDDDDPATYPERHGCTWDDFARWGAHLDRYDEPNGMRYDAVYFPDDTGGRYRLFDHPTAKFKPGKRGQPPCWYGLREAVALAKQTGDPFIVLVNGQPSVIAGHAHGLAACTIPGGEGNIAGHLERGLIAELKAAWSGGIIVLLDGDSAGYDAAPKVAAVLRNAGYPVLIKDAGPGHDAADICRLNNGTAMLGVLGLKELGAAAAPNSAPSAGAAHSTPTSNPLPFRFYVGDAIDQIVAPRQLVKGYLAIGTVALMIGASESGKTTIAADLTNKVAQYYRVLYVAGEDAGNVRAQIRAWELTHGRPRSQNLALFDGPVLLDDAAQMRLFIDAARAFAPRLIVFDTLSACTPGVDDGSADIGPAVASLNRIADELDASVLVLHHPLKYDAATFRGHSSLQNNTHTMILVQRDEGDDLITLKVIRHKGTRAAPTTLRLIIKETDIVDPDDGPISAPVVLPIAQVSLPKDHLSGRQRAILEYLRDVDDDGGATVAEVCREIAAKFRTTEGNVRKDVAWLVKQDLMTASAKQREPRRITPKGQQRIGSDQADQVDQVFPIDPFVINTKLGADPNPIQSANGATPQQDAETGKPDLTRSEPDLPSLDQVPDPRKPDLPDPISYIGSGGSGFRAGEEQTNEQGTPDIDEPAPFHERVPDADWGTDAERAAMCLDFAREGKREAAEFLAHDLADARARDDLLKQIDVLCSAVEPADLPVVYDADAVIARLKAAAEARAAGGVAR